MARTVYAISARSKDLVVMPAGFADFEMTPHGRMTDDQIVSDRNWTLYCMDCDRRAALLVELPAGHDLGSAAFAYVDQFELAQRAVIIPFQDLPDLAAKMPKPARLINLFNIGRCGSTLLSKIFANVAGVWSLSEPDAITNLSLARFQRDPREASALYSAALRLSFRPPAGRENDAFVVKFRSQSVFDIPAIATADPSAINLFLLREPEGWVNSFYRMSQSFGGETGPAPFADYAWRWHILSAGHAPETAAHYMDISGALVAPESFLCGIWRLKMDQFFRASEQGYTFECYSYDALNKTRRTTVAHLLNTVVGHQDDLDGALRAYETDSQSGTTVSSVSDAVPLSPTQRENVRATLAPQIAQLARLAQDYSPNI